MVPLKYFVYFFSCLFTYWIRFNFFNHNNWRWNRNDWIRYSQKCSLPLLGQWIGVGLIDVHQSWCLDGGWGYPRLGVDVNDSKPRFKRGYFEPQGDGFGTPWWNVIQSVFKCCTNLKCEKVWLFELCLVFIHSSKLFACQKFVEYIHSMPNKIYK